MFKKHIFILLLFLLALPIAHAVNTTITSTLTTDSGWNTGSGATDYVAFQICIDKDVVAKYVAIYLAGVQSDAEDFRVISNMSDV